MKETRYLIVSENDVFISEDGHLLLLTETEISSCSFSKGISFLFDKDDNIDYHLYEQSDFISQTHERVSLRQLLDRTTTENFYRAGKAVQYLRWLQEHQYCGRCGKATVQSASELAMVCDRCEVHYYPRLSPCVIGLVVKGNECLLAWHQRSAVPKYSCLAGFIEPGETPENAFVREVKEEVGLKVGAPIYQLSQPWPFPGQLMLGFIAEYMEGDISPEPNEIREAKWFRYDQLPSVPGSNTIAGQLIQRFVNSCTTSFS